VPRKKILVLIIFHEKIPLYGTPTIEFTLGYHDVMLLFLHVWRLIAAIKIYTALIIEDIAFVWCYIENKCAPITCGAL